jgi:hypothetical protein
MSSQDVLTAFDLNQQMVAKSKDVDAAVREYQTQAIDHFEATFALEIKKATARPGVKKSIGPKPTVDDVNAALYVMCADEEYAALRTEALRNGADKAVRATMAQLSALQSQASALKEELRLARTDNYQGGP